LGARDERARARSTAVVRWSQGPRRVSLPPLTAGVPLAIGVLSYAGSLTLTVTGAPSLAVDGARTAVLTLHVPALPANQVVRPCTAPTMAGHREVEPGVMVGREVRG
jgi:hypothetical protein